MPLIQKPRVAHVAPTATKRRSFIAEVATVGPFTVLFSAHQKQKKDEKGNGIKGQNEPTGELNICVEVPSSVEGKSFNTRLQYGPDLRGVLGTIIDHWDEFQEACVLAEESMSDAETYAATRERLRRYLAVNSPDAVEESPEETEDTEETATELDPSLVAGLVTGCPK